MDFKLIPTNMSLPPENYFSCDNDLNFNIFYIRRHTDFY